VGFSTFARPVRLALLAAAVLVLGTLARSAPAATTRAKGVDVSNWQHTIDWTKVAGAGYRFAFGKATEGTTYSDPTYPANRSGSEGAGLAFGAYHFARPAGSSQAAATASAIAQADYFVDVAAPEPGELAPVLDLEATGSLSPTLLTQWTQAWLDEVYARTGVRSFVYSSPSFWNDKLADTTDIAASGYRLWVAHWTSATAPWVPASNWDGTGWSFWQWTNKSTVPGISGRTDADRMNGTNPSSFVIASYPGGAPASLTAPSLVGVAEAGYLLSAVPGAWTGGKPVLFSYQWRRCDAAGANCVAITGATAESYRANAADVGHSLKVVVTATASAGAATAASAASVAVSPAGTPPTARPAAVTPPAIAGTAQVGQTLTSSVGTWSGAPTKFAYSWQRCDPSGASCATIPKATASHYTLTPDDLGSTLVAVVTATGTGGATSTPTSPTGAVVAAPLPPVSIGTQTAQAGIAGNVQTVDGRAVATWQPGSVPIGLVVAFTGVDKAPANAGTGLALSVRGLPAKGFRWPLDVEYAQPLPSGTVVGWSTNGKVFEPVPALAGPKLPARDVAGSYVDSTGLTHVLVRTPLHLAAFPKGGWGDPRFTTPKGPSLARLGSLRLVPQRDHTVTLSTRLSARSQVRLQAWLAGAHGTKVRILGRGSRLGPPLAYPGSYPVAKTERDKPGSFPVRLRLNARKLEPHARYVLHLWATDPWGRHQALSTRFTYP